MRITDLRELSGADGIRTHGLLDANEALSQLSYSPSCGSTKFESLDSNNKIKKFKCFILCRLGARKPFFLSLSCHLGPAARANS